MTQIKTKEQNFISAVVSCSDVESTKKFLEKLYEIFNEHFLQYEIIVATNKTIDKNNFRVFSEKLQKPISIIKLSKNQTHEQCMNAGLDAAIGDYVYEFDTVNIQAQSMTLVWNAYEKSLQGYDIVSVCPVREAKSSKTFYRIFNKYSESGHNIRTDIFRLVSRRAINRVHAISKNLPFRKASYAVSGLKIAEIEFEGKARTANSGQLDLAVDSIVLYTNFAYKAGLAFSLLMLCGTVGIAIYSFIFYLIKNPVPGWTSTALIITCGLTGVFAILTLVLKYLQLILRIVFQRQQYLVESIDKL